MNRSLAALFLTVLSLASFAAELPQAKELKGTFVLPVQTPLTDEDNNFALDFSLRDGGSLSLLANASEKYENGVEIQFLRKGDTLTVKLVDGSNTYDLSEDFTDVKASVAQSLKIDVHGHGHIIVWVGAGDEKEFPFTTRARGKFWKLSVKKGTLTKAVVAKAIDEH